MAAAWCESDFQLQKILAKYITGIAGDPAWTYNLYQNNYVPVVGMLITNFTAATFAGYTAKNQATNALQAPVVAAHIATSNSNAALVFGPSTETVSSQTIYGYYVQDGAGNLLAAEYFATPITVSPGVSVTLTPAISHQNQM